ncbi:MAG: tetratricopeptide repeat protein [Proteobacteria bacterium]|nr:tetratricopeptide repeat protein [Pseudomonadota bacterium]MBU1140562.1 tetratricopeptide repeat protein [Pseudomonadota bacterium]MBU1231363.1 tetratricopeptide repeat protein [Pseudomonadota bacterium]MBU1419606.1 tetratricopeptide repeat protein [Pseudomonadota bacterium]MBU1453891.1 tetratricopeptide repeat protein [Pseudomonadota bacterium]
MTSTNTFMLGQKAFLSGDLAASIKAFSDALQQGDHPFHSKLNRGIAYLKIGQFARAIADFDTIIKEDNYHDQAFFYRGIAKLNQEKNEEAIHDLDSCLALNPERGAAYLARGLAHSALGHRGEAEKDIHDRHALNNVELGEFMEEYIFSDPLFSRTLTLFKKDEGRWKLALTENEVQRLGTIH